MSPHLELLERRIAAGFLPGLSQPGLLVTLRVYHSLLASSLLPRLEAALAQWLPGYTPAFAGSRRTPGDVLSLLLQVLERLQERAASPRFSRSRYTVLEDDGTSCRAVLLCPVLGSGHSAQVHALGWLSGLLNRSAAGFTEDDRKALEGLVAHFMREAPRGAMSARILQVAHDAGIPWRHVVDNVYQLGWGCRSRLLDSSFTDRTSNIGARIARSKSATALVLRNAGIPVPPHQLAANVEQAEAAAASLGYPVVIKPDSEDGGRGVFAGLRSAASLRKAYHQARRLADRILVERHIAGQDYRVYVLEGEVIRVVLRVPAGVTGNGRQSVRELLVELNADPRRHQPGRWQPVVLDEEAEDLLQEQALTADAIPRAGQHVLLRRSANVHSGGTPHDVPLGSVHPDNLLLCARAARLLRLDLAGVDFLIPDIGCSWRDGSAGICEVNTQPQMPPDLPARILGHILPAAGRIPVILVLDNRALPWLQEAVSAANAAGRRTGLATHDGDVLLAGSTIATQVPDSAAAAGVLLADPGLELAIFHIGSRSQMRSGVPVDRCALLVLGGDADFAAEADTLGSLLVPHSSRIWLDPAGPFRGWSGPDAPLVQRMPQEDMAQALLQLCEALP